MSNKICLLVAFHKDFHTLNFSKKYFEPIHVGKANSNVELQIQGDHTGENISNKNSNYNELTALYWAWKNVDADFYGLMHYRRYFCLRDDSRFFRRQKYRLKKLFGIKDDFVDYKKETRPENIESEFKELNTFFQKNVNESTIFVPKKVEFFGLTIKSQYGRHHDINDWNLAASVILKKYPQHKKIWERFENQKGMYAFNMFVMSKTVFNNYLEWLFDVLSEVEKKSNMEIKDAWQSRLCGFLSERLFNFYLLTLQQERPDIKIVELNMVKLYG